MAVDYEFNVGTAFARVAGQHRDAPALKLADGAYVSYDALNRSANAVAAMLTRRGISRGDVVAIVHTKTPPCYGAMIACLKIGAPYVNLDEQNPPARLVHVFGSCRPKLVFGSGIPAGPRAAAESCAANLIDLARPGDAREFENAAETEPDPVSGRTGDDPAYIMYTSGSTGIPKGAIITHGSVLNFGAWTRTRFGITPGDTLSNVNPMYFDNSVFDFYAALLNGASLVPIARAAVTDGATLLDQLEAAHATVWFSVPSLLIYLSSLHLLSPERLPTLRMFVFGGEGYPKPELHKLFERFGARCRLVNVYGPTECTCMCSAWDVGSGDFEDPGGLVTLGPLAPNFSMLVLDDDGRRAGSGGSGELCLLGPQVGLGYINDPERTAAAFVPNPLNTAWRERMYRTGDRVTIGADGRSLTFIGRTDHQVKHMGYRVELGEIEAALNQLDGVAQSAVLQIAGRRGIKLLAAYVACAPHVTEAELRNGLTSLLPPYMIPQRFELERDLPKNANGKIDRQALARRNAEH
jgi:D-alanine--poly(phosphoribitol) ligase subunit 1